MSQLTGRSIKTVITQLEVVADDNSLVLMLSRDTDGNVQIKTRLPHEPSWQYSESAKVFSVKERDAATLAYLLNGADATYRRTQLEEISTSGFKLPAPETPEPSGTTADCTQLDIERARAENIKEERELLRLSLIREHSLDKHYDREVEGCESCENRIQPGYGDGSLPNQTTVYGDGRPTSEPYDSKPDIDVVDAAVDAADLDKELPF